MSGHILPFRGFDGQDLGILYLRLAQEIQGSIVSIHLDRDDAFHANWRPLRTYPLKSTITKFQRKLEQVEDSLHLGVEDRKIWACIA
jgi:hypothetical protein